MSENNENNYMYGILSIVCPIVGLFFFGLILSIVGTVLGCVGLEKESNKALPILGLILSVAELLVVIFSFMVI